MTYQNDLLGHQRQTFVSYDEAGTAQSQSTRLIPYFNGTSQYGTFNTPIAQVAGDKVRFKFSSIFYNPSANQILLFSNTDVAWIYVNTTNKIAAVGGGTKFTAKLDGVPIVFNTTAFPTDGLEHEIELTAVTPLTWHSFAATLAGSEFYKGHIWDIEFEDNSGASPVITSYALNSGSTTTEYAVGESAPSTNYVTFTNFTADSWNSYTLVTGTWDWPGKLVAGAVTFDFYGTATSPATPTILTIGATSFKNWDGLYVTSGAYTYSAAPDGKRIRVSIPDPSSVTIATISNSKLTGAVPNFTPFTSLITAAMDNASLTSYSASVIAPTVTSINLLNNALTNVADIDQLLSDLADSVALTPRTGSLDISGGTNAAPTGGAANPDVLALQAAGWTVTHN